MTCTDVETLLDAFVDAELPGPMLLAVARHAGTCVACDQAVRQLTALHEAVEQTVGKDAESLDLSGVWPGVERRIARVEERRTWARRARSLPAWGAIAAMAAGAALWLRPVPDPPRQEAKSRPNFTVVERLNAAGNPVALRRERKNGTTLIMVSAADTGVRR
jgi:anti-sigma factor RsiW